jgi:dolichol-phosphate mannosyltransferase
MTSDADRQEHPVSGAGIVIPTFREAANIAALVRALLTEVPDAKIVIVDDTEDLSTVAAAADVAGPSVRVVHRAKKDGRGSAVLTGMRVLLQETDARPIVEMDADFSHDPKELPRLIAALESSGAAMVIGSRYLPASRIRNWPVSRRVFSGAANFLARAVLGVPISDYTNGYRIYTREAARVVSETCGRIGRGFIPLSETLVNLYYRGYDVIEVPTIFVNRARGESSVTRREITDALMGLFRIHALKRRLRRAKLRA